MDAVHDSDREKLTVSKGMTGQEFPTRLETTEWNPEMRCVEGDAHSSSYERNVPAYVLAQTMLPKCSLNNNKVCRSVQRLPEQQPGALCMLLL